MAAAHRAFIEIELSSTREARALYASLKPEASAMSSRGLSSTIVLDGARIKITVESSSLSKLRAALNSYLRWLSSFKEVVEWVSLAEGFD